MKISLDCKISLSKKLRNMLGENGSVTLMANGLEDGKGYCKLVLESDGVEMPIGFDKEMPKELKGETSIMVTPITLTEDVPPNNSSQEIGSIFSTSAPTNYNERTSISKLAAEVPPETEDVPHAIVSKEEIKTPEEFKQVENPKYQEFVLNLSELMIEIEKAKTKVSNIDLSAITDPRIRAVEMERKEKMEAIEKSAYVVNEKAGVLTINDLDITLALNSPYDLSNVSAKRLAASSELKSLIKAGYIKFISPEQIQEYINKAAAASESRGLQVFDNIKQAEANMSKTDPKAQDLDTPTVLHSAVQVGKIPNNSMEVTSADLDTLTEEEAMIMDLTKTMGKSSGRSGNTSVRSSIHGIS